MQIVLLPSALDDIEDIGRFIAQDNAHRAVTFTNALHAHIQTLDNFPHRFALQPDLHPDARMALYGAYQIYFLVSNIEVTVIRVLHGARNIEDIFQQ